jgi:hypothetical protein
VRSVVVVDRVASRAYPVGVVFLVAAVGIAVVVTYPGLVREADEEADTNSAQAYVDREIAGGNGLVASQQAVSCRTGSHSR